MRPGALPILLWTAPAGLAATLFTAGQQGVRRWVDLGPLHINVAMVLLPAAAVALAVLARARPWPFLPALLTLALLVAQPDASQATAWAAVLLILPAAALRGRWQGLVLGAAAGLGVVAAWRRPDPLQPVPEVEGVLTMAFAQSTLMGVAAAVLLAAAVAAPALAVRRIPALALSLCLAVSAAAPLIGAFPVPLVGVGPSPILGAWLGVGVLAGVLRGGRTNPWFSPRAPAP